MQDEFEKEIHGLARSRLCVCRASLLVTFAMGGVPHAGPQQTTVLGSIVSFPKYYLILIPSLFGRYFYYHLSFTNEDIVNGFSLSSRVCSEEQGGSQSWGTGIQNSRS